MKLIRRGIRLRVQTTVWATAIVLLSACPEAAAQDQGGSSGTRDFRPRQVVPTQKPITDPPVIPAERVRGQVAGNELVLGVEVDGQVRAYPINMLVGPQREIVNDTLGEVPIAATW